MQKSGFCYRKIRKRRVRVDCGLWPNGRHSAGVFLHQCPPEPNCSPPRGALRWRPPTLFNRCFETCQKHFARPTSVKVTFQFLTQRVVQLLIEVVRKFGEHSLTACRFRYLGRCVMRHYGANAVTRPRFPGFHQFFSNKQARAVESDPNGSCAQPCDLRNIFVGQTLHVP